MRRPASTSATLAPDSASSFASTPPAAPDPITQTSKAGDLSILVFRVRTTWKLKHHRIPLILEILMNPDRGGVISINCGRLKKHEELLFSRGWLVFVVADTLHQRYLLGFAASGKLPRILPRGHPVHRSKPVGPLLFHVVRRRENDFIDVFIYFRRCRAGRVIVNWNDDFGQRIEGPRLLRVEVFQNIRRSRRLARRCMRSIR